MKIKSIELINLKSYKKEKINLSPQINILTGANNAGKSTIIKSLLNFQYNTLYKHDIRVNEGYARIYVDIIDVEEEDNKRFYDAQEPNDLGDSDAYTILCSLSDGNPERLFMYFDSHLNAKRDKYNRIEVKDGKGQNQLKNFPGFPASEQKNNFIYPFLAMRKTDSYYDSNVTKEEFYRVAETLRNLPSKIQKLENSSHPRHSEFVKACEEILGFRVGIIPAENNNGIQVGIYTDSVTTIPIRLMGDGVANILGLITLLLTEDNKLYLIEELENDIHPRALKKLLDLILEKSKNNQFVVSTHSHIVLKYLGVDLSTKIFYIDWSPRDGNNNVPTSSIKEVENTPENRMGILEKLGYDFFDFELHEAYLILEESTAEKVIRDFLIPNIVPELYNKIKTIAANGVNDLEPRLNDFNRLFVFIHTSPLYYNRGWVIADGDSTGKATIQTLQEKYHKKWPNEHFLNFGNENFESYYPKRFQHKVKALLSLKHGKPKQEEKVELMKEVMAWALKNRDVAIQEFNVSAKEVVTILRAISKKLNKKK